MARGKDKEKDTPLEEVLGGTMPEEEALAAVHEDEEEDEEEDEDDLDYDDDEDEEEDDEFLDDFAPGSRGPLRTGQRAAQTRRAANAPVLSDPDLAELNNPDVLNLAEPPMLGARGRTELFGEGAETFGRASSPKLYASAGQFPNCVQFRIWRMENGIPVGLGAIDSEATEEDLVREFFSAMPKPGHGRSQFRLRPIDQRGAELGKEFIVTISEHHSTLRMMREQEKQRLMEQQQQNPWGRGPGGDVIVQGGQDGATASMAEEMGRMFETAVTAAEDQTKHLQATLDMERERLREEERQRVAERIATAERASTTTERMMERLMGSDRTRSEEAMKAQKQHSDLLMTTLTTVFSQQQEASRGQAERMREQDAIRLQQDREYFERQRAESEEKRRQERDEYDRKRQFELEQMRIESAKKEAEVAARRDLEKTEAQLRLEREKMEMEQRREELRQERERLRAEVEERRERDRLEFERKQALANEERERRERADRERWERERLESERKRDEERREWERKEALRREEMQREADRRREESEKEAQRRQAEMTLAMKTMETNAQRDREHAERMAEQSRMERENQREAAERREKMEREAREFQEKERERRNQLQMKEMELSKERDREHAERMLQMSKAQSSGGLSSLTDMLGMETPELLGRIFGGGEVEDNWSDTIAKVVGGVAEMGKVVMAGNQANSGRTPRQESPQRIPVQTPQGVRMLTVDQLRGIQAEQAKMAPQAVPAPSFTPPGLPEQVEKPLAKPAAPAASPSPLADSDSGLSADYQAALEVDSTKRAKMGGLTLKDMRTARRSLRKLSEKLEKANETEWEGIITAAVLSKPVIFGYIEAVSAYVAFAETKSDPELVERVIKALRSSELVPEGSVPFTEADLIAYQKAKSESQADKSNEAQEEEEKEG